MRILWIPHTGWHIPQRAHLFCRALAERHEVHVTDLWADFAGLRDYLSVRYLRNFTYRRSMDGRITVHGVPRISPAIFSRRLRQVNTLLFSTLVRRLIDHYRIDVVVGTFVVPPPRAPRLIFDLFDENSAEWRSGMRHPEYADEIDAVERAYMVQANAIVAASLPLVEKAQRTQPAVPTYFIPNGVDLARFAAVDGKGERARLGLQGWVAGTIGNHNRSEELALVVETAARCVDLPLTFLIGGRGLAMATAEAHARRLRLTNIRFVGPVSPTHLPETVAALDIGLCPYSRTEMDHARSPMRLFAYAAKGIPTVCTNLDSVRELNLDNVILVEDTPEAFAAGISSALELPRVQPRTIAEYDLPVLIDRYERILSGETLDNCDGLNPL